MRGDELIIGRTFGLVLDHGEDFFGTLARLCAGHNISQGYIPMFIAGKAFWEWSIVEALRHTASASRSCWS